MTTVLTAVEPLASAARSRERVPSVSVVVPVFNEAENLDTLFERLQQVLAAFPPDSEVILVDDASVDDSLAIMRELRRRDPRVKILSLARNFGHQVAISAGMQHANGDVVVLMDADLQDAPELIDAFVCRWHEGWDVVYAVRQNRKENVLKRAMYHVFYRVLHRLARIDIPQDSGDFCLMDRRVTDVINSLPERNRFVRGLRSWVGFRQIAVPYDRAARNAGEPKYTWSKLIRLAVDGVVSFSYVPLQLSVLVGFVAALASFLAIIVVLYFRLFTTRSIPGFASTAIIVLFTAGVQLLSVGAIGEYVGRIFDEVKQRPLFVLRERIGFDD
jgi:glycosyltransferase involved in cell wall biosynthesis